jgi:mRNA interferase RelE/StbE
MYTVIYAEKAIKAFLKLDRPTAAMIFGWIDKNLAGCSNPRLHGKALIGDKKGYWRYRVGAYRLIADIQDNLIVIEIINLGHRREIYNG